MYVIKGMDFESLSKIATARWYRIGDVFLINFVISVTLGDEVGRKKRAILGLAG